MLANLGVTRERGRGSRGEGKGKGNSMARTVAYNCVATPTGGSMGKYTPLVYETMSAGGATVFGGRRKKVRIYASSSPLSSSTSATPRFTRNRRFVAGACMM